MVNWIFWEIAMMRLMLVAAVLLTAGGCTHLKGVVEEAPGRPSRTAVFSVGRPDGVAVYSMHRVDSAGRFDFMIPAADENSVYLYDERGDPQTTMRRVDRKEMGDHMQMTVPAGHSGSDMMMPESP
jgi:hypothetical protein